MADPSVTPPPPPAPEQSQDFDIAEEYGTARKNLPPAGVVAICVAVVVAVVGLYAFTHRAKPQSTGSIDDVVGIPVVGPDLVLVALNASIEIDRDKSSRITSTHV